MYTRRWCGLCDEAKEELQKVQAKVILRGSRPRETYIRHSPPSLPSPQRKSPFELEEIDIDKGENQRKYIRFTYDVPVVHLNGKELMRHRVDSAVLMEVLKSPPPPDKE